MLNAISRATDHGRHPAERAKVVKAIFATRDRQSVLGPYGVDANGDTTARTFGVWTIADGKLRFWGKMDGQRSVSVALGRRIGDCCGPRARVVSALPGH